MTNQEIYSRENHICDFVFCKFETKKVDLPGSTPSMRRHHGKGTAADMEPRFVYEVP